jgi:hypothetical protein
LRFEANELCGDFLCTLFIGRFGLSGADARDSEQIVFDGLQDGVFPAQRYPPDCLLSINVEKRRSFKSIHAFV